MNCYQRTRFAKDLRMKDGIDYCEVWSLNNWCSILLCYSNLQGLRLLQLMFPQQKAKD